MNERPTLSRAWLQDEFDRRKEKNAHYSLRAFSNLLDLPSGRISEILADKRKLTLAVAQRIAERLAYDPDERARFLECVKKEKARRGRAKPTEHPDPAVAAEPDEADYRQLSLDAFRVIADWHHFAILSLMELDGFRSEPKWIARRLGLSQIQIRSALDRLSRLELVELKDGAWVSTGAQLTTTHDVSSPALRKSHRQSLEQALESLDGVAVEDRDVTSMTMAIDSRKIPLAKELIRDFRRKLCRVLEQGTKNEVYNLNIQLVPVTKLIKPKRKKS